MRSFNDFVHVYGLKSKTTSKLENQNILSSLPSSDVGIHLRNSPFEPDIGIVILHPSKGTHWVAYINENYFDSYDCAPPNKPSSVIIKRNGYCLYSDYKLQNLDSFCAAYCLYIIFLTKGVVKHFKSAVLNPYYQTIS